MIAQLQAQNPLQPSNTNKLLSGYAQITQVEQTTNLANANELSGAVQLIGRTVWCRTASRRRHRQGRKCSVDGDRHRHR